MTVLITFTSFPISDTNLFLKGGDGLPGPKGPPGSQGPFVSSSSRLCYYY